MFRRGVISVKEGKRKYICEVTAVTAARWIAVYLTKDCSDLSMARVIATYGLKIQSMKSARRSRSGGTRLLVMDRSGAGDEH